MNITRRDVLRGASMSALAGCFSNGMQAQPSAAPWYKSLLVGMELGPTGANDKDSIYMSRATGEDWVSALQRAGSQYGVVFMKDQNFAYYNSRLARKCPNLGSRDLLEECIAAAAKHHIPIVAYCQIQYDTAAWLAHPDWRMKDADGNDIRDRLCYNSPYLEYNREIAKEMLGYEISGFHFDMLDFGFGPPVGCWCSRCRALFEEEYKIAMPPGVTWDDAWDKMLQFRCDSNSRYCQKLQTFVREQKPGISVDFNYHGYPPFAWYPGEKPVQHARNGDFVTAEGLPWIFGNYNPSLLALFMEGCRPGGPVQGVTSRSVYNYHDFSVRPIADMEWEVFTYLAHGAQCTIVDKANYDGSLDPVVYDRISPIFRAASSQRDYFGHPPVREVGLYYSARSRDWYGRTDTEKYSASFAGAHKALVQAHIGLGMLMDEDASLERLLKFPIVYVPNAPILTKKEVENFTEYVERGGNLILTGLTGLCDNRGNLQAHSDIEELAGVRLVRAQQEFPDNYLRLPSALAKQNGQFLTPDIPLDWPILTWGPIVVYESNGAAAFGELLVAFRSQENSWSRHMSPNKVVGPAVFVQQHGKGKVVLVPCLPDAAFIQRYRVPEHRNLLRNLVRFLNPSPKVRIAAPVNVEAIVSHDETRNRLLVHLIGFSAPPTATSEAFGKGRQVLPPTMEEPMEYQAQIIVNQPFRNATCPVQSAKVTARGRQISLSARDVHTVVIINL